MAFRLRMKRGQPVPSVLLVMLVGQQKRGCRSLLFPLATALMESLPSVLLSVDSLPQSDLFRLAEIIVRN